MNNKQRFLLLGGYDQDSGMEVGNVLLDLSTPFTVVEYFDHTATNFRFSKIRTSFSSLNVINRASEIYNRSFD